VGQVAVDLPDPLESPSPVALSDTDDLLAQLADEEIDRLLAESERQSQSHAEIAQPLPGKETPPTIAQPIATTPARTGAATQPVQEEGDSPPPSDAPAPGQTVAQPAPVSPQGAALSTPEVNAQLDKLFNELHQEPPARADQPASVAVAAAPQPQQTPAQAPPAFAEQPPPKIAQQAVAEQPTPSSPPDAAAVLDYASSAATQENLPLPWVLRPLEWINAPLAMCPPSVRQILGKAAIITLVNSVGIIVYVLLFRRH
jgi:hypothetical protein